MIEIAKNLLRRLYLPPEKLYCEQFMYGQREILIEGLGLPKSAIFLGNLQHGWAYCKDPEDLDYYALNNRTRNFVWSKTLANVMIKNGQKNVTVIPSPWSLVLKGYKDAVNTRTIPPINPVQDSILYLPSHPYQYAKFDHNEKVEVVKSFCTDFKEVTTCLYWLDYIDPKIHSIYSIFSKVVCNGYRGPSAIEVPWSPIGGRLSFLYNLLELLLTHEYLLFDEPSTAFMAAITLNKKVMLSGTNIAWELIDSDNKISLNDSNQKRLQKISESSEKFELFKPLRLEDELLNKAEAGFGFDVNLNEARSEVIKYLKIGSNPNLKVKFEPKFVFKI
jgi:hypothetical protein